MGFEKMPQFFSRNGCLYLYSAVEKCWYEVKKTDSIPIDVKDQIKEVQDKADALKDSVK